MLAKVVFVHGVPVPGNHSSGNRWGGVRVVHKKDPRASLIPTGIRAAMRKPLPESHPFVMDVYSTVASFLDSNEKGKLVLSGHSYGGEVANLVAAKLAHELGAAERDRLEIATFGSIYIPSADTTAGMRAFNYINVGDISIVGNMDARNTVFLAHKKMAKMNSIQRHIHYPFIEYLRNSADIRNELKAAGYLLVAGPDVLDPA